MARKVIAEARRLAKVGLSLGKAMAGHSPNDGTAMNHLLDSQIRTIADHELLRRIGEGSFGEVWLARNVIGTYRAIKVVHRKTFESDRPFDREFSGLKKFEPISRSYPGWVSILHV